MWYLAKTCSADAEVARMVVIVLLVMLLAVVQLCAVGTAAQEPQQTTRKYRYLDSKYLSIYKFPNHRSVCTGSII